MHWGRALLLIGLATISTCPPVFAVDPIEQRLNDLLAKGSLCEAVAEMTRLSEGSNKNEARLGLAVAKLLQTIERLVQTLARFGADSEIRLPAVVDVRIPIPLNRQPERASYRQIRSILERMLDDLDDVEKTLSSIDDSEVKLPLRLGSIRLDLNGDGKVEEAEGLSKLYEWNAREKIEQTNAEQFVVSLDRADVMWLRGYCHSAMAVCEIALAYDGQDLFERAGHIVFPRPESPHEFVATSFGGSADILDWIALIHGMRFELREPQRMMRALQHLQAAVACSRAMWKAALAETDDDHEWVPSPSQTNVDSHFKVSLEMVTAWQAALDELDQLLAGKKLIPFWRGGKRGVNLRRVFAEPRAFDLVYWIQGSDASPYLEDGDLTSAGVWDRLFSAFGDNFLGIALRIN